jgi:hypothetical protein
MTGSIGASGAACTLLSAGGGVSCFPAAGALPGVAGAAGCWAKANPVSSNIAVKTATIEYKRNLIMFSLSSLRPALLGQKPALANFPFSSSAFSASTAAFCPSPGMANSSPKCSKRGIVTREWRVLLNRCVYPTDYRPVSASFPNSFHESVTRDFQPG